MKVARMISTDLQTNELPTTWSHPRDGKVYTGAQVLDVTDAVHMAMTGADGMDDWYGGWGEYGHMAILEVTGTSGEEGGETYSAITAEDVVKMKVLDIEDIDLKNAMLEIALELGQDPDTEWYRDDDEWVGMLFSRMRAVDAEWIETI